MIRHDKIAMTLSALFATGSISLFVYLWVDLGDRGMRADALQNGDHLTILDGALIATMLVLAILSVAGFRSLKRVSPTYKKRFLIAILIAVSVALVFCTVQSFSYR